MPQPLPARAPARFFGALSAIGAVALLSACGGQPAATNAEETPIENAANLAGETAVNEAAPEVAGTSEATNAAAPTTVAPAAKTEAPVAKTETPAAVPAKAEKPAPTTASAGDAANGAKLFAQCKICHSVEPGKNGLGPSLHNINGRKAASVEGFTYSAAMQNSGITWTDAALSEYLRAPMKMVPGTKMAFAGMPKDSDRADVIAYLDTLK